MWTDTNKRKYHLCFAELLEGNMCDSQITAKALFMFCIVFSAHRTAFWCALYQTVGCPAPCTFGSAFNSALHFTSDVPPILKCVLHITFVCECPETSQKYHLCFARCLFVTTHVWTAIKQLQKHCLCFAEFFEANSTVLATFTTYACLKRRKSTA